MNLRQVWCRPVIYVLIGLLLALGGAAAAVWFWLQNRRLKEQLAGMADRAEELKQVQAIRRNLQYICDRRGAELNRIRGIVHRYEDQIRDMEAEISRVNVQMFEESGRRILAQKDEGTYRIKLNQAEKELDDLRRRLREGRAVEARLRAELQAREEEIGRLRAPKPRRAARRSADPLETGQITVDDLLGGAGKRTGA